MGIGAGQGTFERGAVGPPVGGVDGHISTGGGSVVERLSAGDGSGGVGGTGGKSEVGIGGGEGLHGTVYRLDLGTGGGEVGQGAVNYLDIGISGNGQVGQLATAHDHGGIGNLHALRKLGQVFEADFGAVLDDQLAVSV